MKNIPNELIYVATLLLHEDIDLIHLPSYEEYKELTSKLNIPFKGLEVKEGCSGLPKSVYFCIDLFRNPDFEDINNNCLTGLYNMLGNNRKEEKKAGKEDNTTKYFQAKEVSRSISFNIEKLYKLKQAKENFEFALEEMSKDGSVEVFNEGKVVAVKGRKDWYVAAKDTVLKLDAYSNKETEYTISKEGHKLFDRAKGKVGKTSPTSEESVK